MGSVVRRAEAQRSQAEVSTRLNWVRDRHAESAELVAGQPGASASGNGNHHALRSHNSQLTSHYSLTPILRAKWASTDGMG